MKEAGVGYEKEFEELIGSLAQSTRQIQDPVAIGVMLYSIAEERKNTNLVVRQLNAKIDSLLSKIETFEKQQKTEAPTITPSMSERDIEVLNYVGKHTRICAEDLQKVFRYKGKNAASARLSKLFHEGRLEKEYAGRTVYYKVK